MSDPDHRRSIREVAVAAFHLGQELGSPVTPEEFDKILEALGEIAAGELTLIGSHLPGILQEHGEKVSPDAGNLSVIVEREAARLVLGGFEAARRRFEEPEK